MSLNHLTGSIQPLLNANVSTLTSGSVNVSGLTENKIVATDSSKNLVSSSLDASDIVTLSTAQTITGAKNFSTPASLIGVTNNSSASAGYVGEYIKYTMTNVTCAATNTYMNMASQLLNPGDWVVSLQGVSVASDEKVDTIQIGISIDQIPNTFSDFAIGDNSQSVTFFSGPPYVVPMNVTNYRLSLGSPTIVQMKLRVLYTGNPIQFTGRFCAQRMR